MNLTSQSQFQKMNDTARDREREREREMILWTMIGAVEELCTLSITKV